MSWSRSKVSLIVGGILVALVLVGCSQSRTANFPQKTIQIIVPFAAGGGTDLVARAVADAAKSHFPKPVVIVNKTGAGGAVGMGEGANAKPDGYTVTMICVELATLPPQNLAPFTSADFRPILQINAEPAAITVKADAPWNTVTEFLDYAKKTQEKLKWEIPALALSGIWRLRPLS